MTHVQNIVKLPYVYTYISCFNKKTNKLPHSFCGIRKYIANSYHQFKTESQVWCLYDYLIFVRKQFFSAMLEYIAGDLFFYIVDFKHKGFGCEYSDRILDDFLSPRVCTWFQTLKII